MMILLPILVWVNLIGLNSFYVLQKKRRRRIWYDFQFKRSAWHQKKFLSLILSTLYAAKNVDFHSFEIEIYLIPLM